MGMRYTILITVSFKSFLLVVQFFFSPNIENDILNVEHYRSFIYPPQLVIYRNHILVSVHLKTSMIHMFVYYIQYRNLNFT
jgi:hypothetical protein